LSQNGTRRGSLVVVGVGLSVAGQTTVEAVDCIRGADEVFYATPNPATEVWIRRLNAEASTLTDCYAHRKPREKTYREMTDRILSAVRAGRQVCAVFYGHPGVFVDPAHDAVRRARREGFSARMLPGISTEDCLFADLGINAGEVGWQSFEATDFLAARRRFDPTSALIIWQVGLLGEGSLGDGTCRRERLQVLAKTLRRHYPPRHRIVLYEAAQFPLCEPIIRRIPLTKLPETKVPILATLYVPPRPQRALDERIMRWLDEP
jgi:precorrin-2 methylase